MGSKTYALMAKKFAKPDNETLGKIQEQAQARAKAAPGREGSKTGTRIGRYYISKAGGEKVYVK